MKHEDENFTMHRSTDSESRMAGPELSILIPVFNEHATIRQMIDKVRGIDFGGTREIIVVDDGSSDGTSEVLAALPKMEGVRIVWHARNGGKGSAIQTALRHVTGRYVVIQDADLELTPEDIIPLFEVVRSGRSLVCYGSRFYRDCSQFLTMPTYWANRFLTLVCNLINGQHLTDMNTCYKMMRVDIARRIKLVSRGFAMEPEITTKLGCMGVSIVERPISYRPRSKAEGKKIRPFDLVRYLIAMVRFRLMPDSGSPAAIGERLAPSTPRETAEAPRAYLAQPA